MSRGIPARCLLACLAALTVMALAVDGAGASAARSAMKSSVVLDAGALQAKAAWEESGLTDDAHQGMLWQLAITFLQHAIASGANRASSERAIASLKALIRTPETNVTAAQRSAATRDTKSLNVFFATPGLLLTRNTFPVVHQLIPTFDCAHAASYKNTDAIELVAVQHRQTTVDISYRNVTVTCVKGLDGPKYDPTGPLLTASLVLNAAVFQDTNNSGSGTQVSPLDFQPDADSHIYLVTRKRSTISAISQVFFS